MPTLHVRNIPDMLHARIQQLAQTEHCSLSTEVITLLDHAVTERENRLSQRQVLESIRKRRSGCGRCRTSTLNMLQEDRGR